MDKLSDLPVADTVKTPEEEAVIGQYFPEDATTKKSAGSRLKSVNWKVVGLATLLFILLANPMSNSVVKKLPYIGSSKTTGFLAKLVLFVILIVIGCLLV